MQQGGIFINRKHLKHCKLMDHGQTTNGPYKFATKPFAVEAC